MTPTDELLALLTAATEGPWEAGYEGEPDDYNAWYVRGGGKYVATAHAVTFRDPDKHHGADHNARLIVAAINALPSLLSRLAELEAKAARYDWLREQKWNTSMLFVVAGGKNNVHLGTDCPMGDRLDAAIDAARGKEGL